MDNFGERHGARFLNGVTDQRWCLRMLIVVQNMIAPLYSQANRKGEEPSWKGYKKRNSVAVNS
jgi:hypothetical protein